MPTPSNTPKRKIIPIIILALCVAGVAYVQVAESIEGNFRVPLALLIILATVLLLAIWVVLLSGLRHGLRWRIVGTGFLCLVLFGFSLGLVTRRDGSFSGAGVPRLVLRWTPVRTLPPPAVTSSLPAAVQPSPDDFPQFHGPDRDSQIRGVHLARDWAKNPPVLLWRHAVGLGWSGFAVVGNAAITMEERGDQESAICYNLNTGQPIWVHSNTAYLIEREGGDGPRATPTIAGGHVYTYGGLGNLDCLDAATGKPIWSKKTLGDPSDHLRYGQTSSPLIVDDKVIVTGGHAAKDHAPCPSVLAFDKETGQPAWTFTGDDASYASPSLATVDGVRQILLVHQNGIAGHDIADGKVLWQCTWNPGFWPKNSQAMAIDSDKIYCSTGYGIGSILLQIHGSPTAINATQLWHTPIMKTELSNVVIRDGYVYGLDDGHLICQELSTGKRLWRRQDPYGHGQILQAGELLLAQSESGDVSLLDTSPAGATELCTYPALTGSKTCWNPPALAGHLLVIRNDREAACYRLP
jgi:outer membrane protein assembly factor BamB